VSEPPRPARDAAPSWKSRSEGLDGVVFSRAAECPLEPVHREPAQVGAHAAAADQEQAVVTVEVARPRPDHGLYDHVPQQTRPEL